MQFAMRRVAAALVVAVTVVSSVVGAAAVAAASAPPVVLHVAGRVDGVPGNSGDGGPASNAAFHFTSGLAFGPSGVLYVVDTGNNRVRKIDASGVVTNLAGDAAFGAAGNSGDGGPAVDARLSAPNRVAVDGAGNVFVSDAGNNRVRKIDTAGVISNVAGSPTGDAGNSGDEGLATAALLDNPTGLSFDQAGNLYVADYNNHRVRRIDTAGVIHNFAGDASGIPGNDGDEGPATSAHFDGPADVATTPDGGLIVSEWSRHRVRYVDAAGVIHNFAGQVGAGGNAGDSGPAIAALLNLPSGVAVDGAGNVFIADHENNKVRVVDSTGVIRTFAGSEAGDAGNTGDGGVPTDARFDHPAGLAMSPSGELYIADSHNNRVRRIAAAPPDADADAPTLTITSAPSGTVEGTTASVSFTVADSVDPAPAVVCALDGARATPCASPMNYSGLALTAHTLEVTATDAAGNTATASASWVNADSTAPGVTIMDAPSGVHSNGVFVVRFDVQDAIDASPTVVCAINDAPAAPCASPVQYEDLTPGHQTFVVTATDASGNRATASAEWDIAGESLLTVNVLEEGSDLPLEGQCLELRDNAGELVASACDASDGADAVVHFTDLPEGRYTVVEPNTGASRSFFYEPPRKTVTIWVPTAPPPNNAVTVTIATVDTGDGYAPGSATAHVTATDANGVPVAGRPVALYVSGTNTAAVVAGMTDSNGTATLPIARKDHPGNYAVVPGTDTIHVCDDLDASGTCESGEPEVTHDITWQGGAPEIVTITQFDAVTGDGSTHYAPGSTVVKARVRDAHGVPMISRRVTVIVTGRNPAIGTATTDVNGIATVFVSSTTMLMPGYSAFYPGDDAVFVCDDTDHEESDFAQTAPDCKTAEPRSEPQTITWQGLHPEIVSITQADGVTADGSTHYAPGFAAVKVRVRDANGNLLSARRVSVVVGGTNPAIGTGTTDGNGIATVFPNSTTPLPGYNAFYPGDDTVVVCDDTDGAYTDFAQAGSDCKTAEPRSAPQTITWDRVTPEVVSLQQIGPSGDPDGQLPGFERLVVRARRSDGTAIPNRRITVVSTGTNPGRATGNTDANGLATLLVSASDHPGPNATTAGVDWLMVCDDVDFPLTDFAQAPADCKPAEQSLAAIKVTWPIVKPHLAIDTIANVVAGAPFTVTVKALDESNQVDPSFTGLVTLAAGVPQGGSAFVATPQANATAGTATFSVSLGDAANGYSIGATSGSASPATSNAFNVTASHLAVTAVSTVVAGSPFAVTVRAVDAYGYDAENFGGPVSLTVNVPTGGSSVAVAPKVAGVGVASFTGVLLNDAANGYSVTATGGGFAVTSSPFNVTASHLGMSSVGNVMASVPFGATVTALDANNATAENFTGLVSVQAVVPQGGSGLALPQFMSASGGSAVFSNLLLFDAADGYRVMASSLGLPDATSNTFNVTASHLAVTAVTAVSTVVAGSPFAVTVRAVDAYGYDAENFGGPVSLTVNVPTGGSGLAAPVAPGQATKGVASFTGVVLNDAANGYTVTATGGGLTATSNPFNVTASHLAVDPVANVISGAPFTITVRALDASNQNAENFTRIVTLSAAAPSGGANFSPTPAGAASAGVVTFNGLVLNTPANGYVVTASSPGVVSGASNAFNVLPAPDTAITSGPPRYTNSRQATFQFAGRGSVPAARFECSLDGAAWARCTSPFRGTVAAGEHQFAVRAVSAAGIADPTPAVMLWGVDQSNPTITIVRPTSAVYTRGAIVKAQYSCTDVGVAGIATCDGTVPNGATIDTSTRGLHLFTVHAADRAGNETYAAVVYLVN